MSVRLADAGEAVSRPYPGPSVTFLPTRPRLPGQAPFPWAEREHLNEAGTQLAGFFSVLLESLFPLFTAQYFNEARQARFL